MTITTHAELRRRLDACETADDWHAARGALDHALNMPTIRALLTAVEAAWDGLPEIENCEDIWDCADGCCTNIDPRHGDLRAKLYELLAPLFPDKEADRD